MGYPMTYQRVLLRSRLRDGDYDSPPAGFPRSDFEVVSWLKMFAGDLRRLERDTGDERATTQAIALRTGIDPEIVAAALKAFIAW